MPEARKCPQCGASLPAGALEGLCPGCLLKQGAATDTGAASEATSQVGPNGTRVVEPPGPPTIPELAKLFPQLEILAFIGRGGMGAVYKARQPALDRLVALKILPPQAGSGPGFSERFTREARALARLNHPNIVAVYDFGQVGQAANPSPGLPDVGSPAGTHQAGGMPVPLHYFIMEFIDGLNLRQVEQAGRLSPREALQIIPQICDALQYAHDEGVVHRDIKPENVLIDRKGRVKIADFGLAKILGREPATARLTGEGQVMGTPHYMAPEQIEHPLQVDHRADIYSLGVVFYEMLTGELPLGRFAPPSEKVRIDVRLDEVVLHALEKEPERRYQQASQVKTQVETIATSMERATAPAGLVGAPSAGTPTNKSPFVRVLELLFGAAFTSPLAIKLINVSALGFLGSLGFLGYLPLPGMHHFFGFFGFAGFFGLIGFGFMVELVARRNTRSRPAPLPPNRGNRRFALLVGLAVFAGTALVLASITFTLPRSYVGLVRISTERGAEVGRLQYDPDFMQTEIARITSEKVLSRVIVEHSGFRRQMQREAGKTWSDTEALEMLRSRLAVTQVRSTSLLEIRYYAGIPHEAAEVANRIAEIFCAVPANRAEIIERAAPALRPVRPNIPLNLAIGAMTAVLLGLFSGGLTLLLTSRHQRNRSQTPGTPPMAPRADRFWKHFASGVAAVVLALILVPAALIAIRLILPMVSKQKAPPRTNAVPTTDNGAALRLKLQFAEQGLREVEKRREVGMATPSDYEKAKGTRDIASAELKGNAAEVARIRLCLAELELKEVENKQSVGSATPLDYEKAKCSRDIAAAEMMGDSLEVMRIRLRLAELELNNLEKMREVGRATPSAYDQARLARDLAAIAYSQEQKSRGDANTSPRFPTRIDSKNGKVRIKVGTNILETESIQFGVGTNGAMVLTSSNLSSHTLPNAEPAPESRPAPSRQRTNDPR